MLGLQTRIPRGVDRLDVRLPGWQEKIDIARLDMSSNTDGLLEQLFGRYGYYPGLTFLGLRFAGGYQHGFDIETDSDEDYEQWAELTEAWKQVIQQKKAAT